MTARPNRARYDLEKRIFDFAKSVRLFARKLILSISNIEDAERLLRSSGSVGTNFIEANESSSKKDFLMRVKISHKEAKESAYWLKLIGEVNGKEVKIETTKLYHEAIQLTKILSSIIEKSK
ncbi:MAG: four helix bundle protein [Candidatus Binatia bacterium]